MSSIWFNPNVVGGDNSGSSAANACITFAQVNTAFTNLSWTAGDTLYIAQGIDYDSLSSLSASRRIAPTAGGTAANHCKITTYEASSGTAKPILRCTGFNLAGSAWTLVSGSIYRRTISAGAALWVDGTYVKEADDTLGNPTAWTTGGLWHFHDGTDMYLDTNGAGEPSATYTKIGTGPDAVVDLGTYSYFDIDGLDLRTARYGINGTGDNNTVDNCNFQDVFCGVYGRKTSGDMDGFTVTNCTGTRIASICYPQTTGTDNTTNAVITDNTITIHADFDNSTFYPDTEGIPMWNAQSCTIRKNKITQAGTPANLAGVSDFNGIDLFTDPNGSCTDNVIEQNEVYSLGGASADGAVGITIGSGNVSQTYSGNIVRDNIIYDITSANSDGAGIKLSLDDATCKVQNNSVEACDYNYHWNDSALQLAFTKNLSTNPVGEHVFEAGVSTVVADENMYKGAAADTQFTVAGTGGQNFTQWQAGRGGANDSMIARTGLTTDPPTSVDHFLPKPWSPLVNTGSVGTSQDFAGNFRIGVGCVGAVEYLPLATDKKRNRGRGVATDDEQFNDTFTEGANTNAEDHTPDDGLNWTLEAGTAGDLIVLASADYLYSNALTGAGNVLMHDDLGVGDKYAECRIGNGVQIWPVLTNYFMMAQLVDENNWGFGLEMHANNDVRAISNNASSKAVMTALAGYNSIGAAVTGGVLASPGYEAGDFARIEIDDDNKIVKWFHAKAASPTTWVFIGSFVMTSGSGTRMGVVSQAVRSRGIMDNYKTGLLIYQRR